jgi:hypothetical protein
MNKLLRRLRRISELFIPPPKNKLNWEIEFSYEHAQYFGQEVSDIIKSELMTSKPTLITRFGSDVLMCAMDYWNQPNLKNTLRYLTNKVDCLGWRFWTRELMWNNAGFYPPTDENLSKYGKLIYDLIGEIDILGTIMKQESFFEKELFLSKKVKLEALEPYYYDDPWTTALKDKNVLVIHPFEESIQYQYKNNREFLFKNKDILPEFNLQTIKAVQSIAKNKTDFSSWFDAFEYMKAEIDKKDFDIAIIGCGAYGMPLAGYVKSIGKKAIHLGGATQLLFGIKGKRWEEENREFYKNLFNEHWIRPLKEDYPLGYEKIEDGCYW